LGWAKRGTFVPEFEATAFKLKEGEISEIIETEFGFHLLKLMKKRGGTVNVRHVLITPTITSEDEAKARAFLDSIRLLIMVDSIKFTDAVIEFGEEKTASFNNAGRVSNPATGNTFFEVGELDPEVYFSIDTLKVLGITNPVETSDPTGKKLYKLIQLDSRSAPHQANLKQDYSKLQKFAKNKKTNDKLELWVKDKVASTYLWVDPIYECQFFADWIMLQVNENEKTAKVKP
jgi:peptidyl-prolyl cis-trans isomerase SurA